MLTLKRSLRDFDEFTETIRAWDLEFIQLERGPFHGSISQFVGGSVHFGRARLGRALEQKGSSPRGLRTFVIPADHFQRFYWRGQRVSGTQILIFPQDGELHAVSDSAFDIFSFSVSEEVLDNAATVLGLPGTESLLGHKEVFEGNPGDMRRLQRICAQLNHRIRGDLSNSETAALQQRLERDLAGSLSIVLAASFPFSAPPSPRLRSVALQRSLEYIRAHPKDPLTVRDLVSVSGSSWRTLEYAFLERFGVPPKAYLKNLRLNAAKKELRRSDPSSTRISFVATSWGFWHMGKFAVDYRRLFGESPSETLKRPAM